MPTAFPREGRVDRHRRRGRLERARSSSRRDDLAGQFRQVLAQHARHPRRGRRRARAYRADDLVRHRHRRISRQPRRDRRGLARADRQATSRPWRWSASPPWSSRGPRSRSKPWRWCPNDATASSATGCRPPDAQPDFLFDLARAPISRAAQRRGRADRPAGPGRARRAQRCRRLDLWRDEGPVRPDRPPAGRAARAWSPATACFLRGPNNAMLFASWLGVLKAGGVVVATMPMLRPGEIATILERARISHAIVDARFRADFDAAGGDRLDRSPMTATTGFEGLDDDRARLRAGRHPPRRRRPDRLHLGHDRQAQGLRPLSPRHPRPADSFARHILKPEPGDRWACSAPIAFTFGLGMLLIFPWRFGGTAVTIETPGPEAAARRRRAAQGDHPRHRAHRLQGDDPAARRARHLVARAPASRPASICPPRPGTPGGRRPASASSTASARPR